MSTADMIPPLYRSIIHYDTQFNVLICIPCGTAVCRYSLVRYFSERVHHMKNHEYKPMLNCLTHLNMPDRYTDLPSVPDYWEPRFGLPVHQGWQCKFCPEFRTAGQQVIQRHMSNTHNIRPARYKLDKADDRVALQSWHKGGSYWIVEQGEKDHELDGNASLIGRTAEDDLMEGVRQAQVARQSRQLERQNILTPGNDADDNSLWLNFTGWKKIFLGKDIVIISETRLIRSEDAQILKQFNISQNTIQLVFDAFDVLIDRCRETLFNTTSELRSWLNSYKRTEPSHRPFHAHLLDTTLKRSVHLALRYAVLSLENIICLPFDIDINLTGRACSAYACGSVSFRKTNVKNSMESHSPK